MKLFRFPSRNGSVSCQKREVNPLPKELAMPMAAHWYAAWIHNNEVGSWNSLNDLLSGLHLGARRGWKCTWGQKPFSNGCDYCRQMDYA
jgi:hypothetical protein